MRLCVCVCVGVLVDPVKMRQKHRAIRRPAPSANCSGASFPVNISTSPAHCLVPCPVVVRAVVGPSVTVSPSSLSFAYSSGAVPASQSFTITAIDDTIAQGTHYSTVSFVIETSSPVYSTLSIPSVSVTIADNDNTTTTVPVTAGVPSTICLTQPCTPMKLTIPANALTAGSSVSLTVQQASAPPTSGTASPPSGEQGLCVEGGGAFMPRRVFSPNKLITARGLWAADTYPPPVPLQGLATTASAASTRSSRP